MRKSGLHRFGVVLTSDWMVERRVAKLDSGTLTFTLVLPELTATVTAQRVLSISCFTLCSMECRAR